MRLIVEVLLRALPLDARGRRAIDETLVDWSVEGNGRGVVKRSFIGARAMVALLRVVSLIAIRETPSAPYGRLLFFTLALTSGLCLVTDLPNVQVFPAESRPALWISYAAANLTLMFPAALFLTVLSARRARGVSALGLAVVSVTAMLLVTGWLLPNANDHFRETANRGFAARTASGDPRMRVVGRGAPEMTLPALIQETARPRRAYSLYGLLDSPAELGFRLGVSAACLSLILLAARLRPGTLIQRAVAIVTVLSVYSVTVYGLGGMPGSVSRLLFRGASMLMFAGVCLLITVALERFSVRPIDPEPGTAKL